MTHKLFPSIEQVPSKAMPTSSPLSSPNGELSRLLAAAVVNRKFRDLLLANPAAAIETGQGEESFNLTSDEKALILPIQHAQSLADFASKLINNHVKATQ
ncbi:MAG TPA: hypothetical protein VGD99_29680 [Anaerolineae bacterium]|jgi:hypothetical protein